MTTNGTRNLYQKLAAIAGEVGTVKATGKTQYGDPAISIADVEDALRSLFAKHGVVSFYDWNEAPITIDKGLLQVDLKLSLINADDPTNWREFRLIDWGSTPSAAVSFALKRFFRALFHLADASDEGPQTTEKIQPTDKTKKAASMPERRSSSRGVPRGAGEAHNPTEQSPGGRAAASDGGDPAKASPPAPPQGLKERLEARRKDLLVPLQVASALTDALKIDRSKKLTQADADLLDRALEVFSSGAKTVEEVAEFVLLEANADHELSQEKASV